MKKLLLHTVALASFVLYAPSMHGAAFSSSRRLFDDPGERKRPGRNYEEDLNVDLKRLCINDQQMVAPIVGIGSLQILALWSLVKDAIDKGNAEILASYDALMQYLASQGVIESYIPHDFVDVIAKQLYLHLKSDKNIPAWLQQHISVSVQDLINHDMVPPFRFMGKKIILDLDRKYINDLAGLNQIPGIENVNALNLSYNKLVVLQPNAFVGFSNLTDLYLNDNQITTIEPGAFVGLGKVWLVSLIDNKLKSIKSDEFEGLSNLENLLLRDNPMTGVDRWLAIREVHKVAPRASVSARASLSN